MRRVALVTALCGLILGCGGSGTAPLSKTRMIVVGTASGPIFDALRARYQVLPYGSGTVLGPGRLLVIDGASTSAEQLKKMQVIDEAMRTSTSLLILNATHEHKVALSAASPRIGAYVNGGHYGYLVTPKGRSGIDIVHAGLSKRRVRTHYSELSNTGVLTGRTEEKLTTFDLDTALISRFVGLVDERLRGVVPMSRDSGSDPPSQVARYTTAVTDSFIDNGNIVPGQTTTQNVTFFFDVYENDGGPGKQFQWLVAYATGLVDPGTPAQNNDRTRGWFQTSVQVDIAPDPSGNGGLLQDYFYGPQPSENSYQATMAFPLVYAAGTQVYLYSLELPEAPQSIPGWSLTTLPPKVTNGQSLYFYQRSPYAEPSWESGFSHGGLVLDWTVKSLNPTSINQFPIYMLTGWTTASLTTEPIVMQYAVGSSYDQLHAKYDSPGIYTRQHTPITTEPPDPSSITLLFGRATSP